MTKRNTYVSNLKIHLIFTVKYRKQLLIGFGEEIKALLLECSLSSNTFSIETIEVDKDHIHMLISYLPTENISNIVKKLKSFSTFHIWQRHEDVLEVQFWKKKMFWSKTYFVCSIGNASEETIKRYIEEQGNKQRKNRRNSSFMLKH